jgi:hypothetical protein
MNLRVSVTTLESFRLWSDPEQEWMSEDDLINGILGRFIPTPEVLLGQDYGLVIEHPEKYRVEGGDGYACKSSLFPADAIDPMLALFEPRGLFEVKTTAELDGCVVVTKCDHIRGLHIDELKTTCSSFDAEKYLHSCQWRFMALLFEAADITYRVACLSDTERNGITLRSIESVNVYPYGGMRDDCLDLLRKFKHYVKVRGLDSYLREKQEKAEKRVVADDRQGTLEGMFL